MAEDIFFKFSCYTSRDILLQSQGSGSALVTAPTRQQSALFCFPQVICDKIFRRWFSPSLRGPLVSFPLQPQLQKAVQECAEPGRVDAAAHQRPLKSLSKLYHLLRVSQRELLRAE